MCALALAAAAVFVAGCDPGGSGGGETAQRGAQGTGAAATDPVRADRPSFDGARAMELVRTQVDFGPRVPGTEGHAAQLAWMLEQLREHADTVVTDAFTHTASDGSVLELTNVLASFRPDSEHRVLLLTHWDTRPISDQAADPEDRDTPVPGANDGASGTAVLLELARMMASAPPGTGVDLLFVDGEDYGPTSEDMFLGARRYAEGLASGDGSGMGPARPRYGVLLDMVGDAEPRFPVEGYSAARAPQVVQRVWGVAMSLGYGRTFTMDVGGYVNDDHVPLNDAGLPTINIIDFDYGPGHAWWHTPEDTPDKLSPRTLGMVGEVVAELVYQGG
jgi:Zn-dependent M28 family amino/carboxypeptidase